jgi:hypothetical protein
MDLVTRRGKPVLVVRLDWSVHCSLFQKKTPPNDGRRPPNLQPQRRSSREESAEYSHIKFVEVFGSKAGPGSPLKQAATRPQFSTTTTSSDDGYTIPAKKKFRKMKNESPERERVSKEGKSRAKKVPKTDPVAAKNYKRSRSAQNLRRSAKRASYTSSELESGETRSSLDRTSVSFEGTSTSPRSSSRSRYEYGSTSTRNSYESLGSDLGSRFSKKSRASLDTDTDNGYWDNKRAKMHNGDSSNDSLEKNQEIDFDVSYNTPPRHSIEIYDDNGYWEKRRKGKNEGRESYSTSSSDDDDDEEGSSSDSYAKTSKHKERSRESSSEDMSRYEGSSYDSFRDDFRPKAKSEGKAFKRKVTSSSDTDETGSDYSEEDKKSAVAHFMDKFGVITNSR